MNSAPESGERTRIIETYASWIATELHHIRSQLKLRELIDERRAFWHAAGSFAANLNETSIILRLTDLQSAAQELTELIGQAPTASSQPLPEPEIALPSLHKIEQLAKRLY